MDFRDYLRAVRQRWWLVLTTVGVALGLTGFVTVRAEPQYATEVTFFVTTPGKGVTDAYQGSLFMQSRIKSYGDLLTSDRLARNVVRDSHLGLTVEQVRSRVSARVETETVLLRATVTDSQKDRSLALGKALTSNFIALVQDIETPPDAQKPSIKIEVIGGPSLNPDPVSPRPIRNLSLAGLLGLLLGAALAVLREMTDNTIRDESALQRAASMWVLGKIPFEPTARSSPLLVGTATNSARAEAVRKLRTNLRFVNVGQTMQAIAITSAVPGEGKTTMACNLSIMLADAGWRVLLVDADLRRPRLADYLGLEARVGLTDVLIGDVALHDVVQPWGDRSLSVLPSGTLPPNPSELLGSAAMSDLLASLKEQADIVVIDTAPLLSVTDGAVTAAQADGALLISHCGRTSATQAAGAAEALKTAGARLLGAVLNMAAVTKRDAYYYAAYQAAAPEPVRDPGMLGTDPLPLSLFRPEGDSGGAVAARDGKHGFRAPVN